MNSNNGVHAMPGSNEFVTIRNVDIYEKQVAVERDLTELKHEFRVEQKSLKTMFSVLSFLVMPIYSTLIGIIVQSFMN